MIDSKPMTEQTQSSLRVLLVEDNVQISRNIADYFADSEILMDFAYDGEQALNLALSHYYDVILLDLMLPKMDGWQVCQLIRERSERHIPILMLTARDSLLDKLQGFELGADDYLTKPFAFEELHARITALMRRPFLHQTKLLTLGPLTLDTAKKQLTREGQSISLNPIPMRIIHILIENHPRAISRSELVEKIWRDEQTDSDALRSHIYQLRQALDKPFSTPLLKTIHGVGFRLDIADE